MAKQTTVELSPVKEIEDIEYSENVPPGIIAFPQTSELKDKHGVVIGSFSARQSGQSDPHSAFSTPAPKSGNSKAGRSGFPSALTPILKQLNIHNSSSPPTFANSQKETGSNQSYNTDIAHILSRRSLVDVNTPVCWLVDECLPEVTFLDITCDTTEQLSKNDLALPDSMPSTPVTGGFMHGLNSPMLLNNKNPDVIQSKGAVSFCPQTNSLKRKPLCKTICTRPVSETSSNHHQTSQCKHPSRVSHATLDHSQIVEASKGEMMAGKHSVTADVPESIDAPLRWLDDRYFPEITLLDVTHNSDFSPKGEMPPLEVKQDVPVSGLQNNLPPSALGGEAEAEPGIQDKSHSDLSRTLDSCNFMDTTRSLCEQADKHVDNNTKRISLGITQDISVESALEDSRPSLESSGQCTAMTQTSVDGTPGVHPINVTRDISSSSNTSVHCAASHTEHTHCNTSSQNVASAARCDLEATSTNVTADGKELLTSQRSSMLSEQSPKPSGSVNNTFTVVPHVNLNTSVPADATAQTLGPQNKTQDLSPSNGSSPKSQKDMNNQPTTESKNTNESSLQNFSSGMPSSQNATFEKLQKSPGSTILGEDGATNVNIQNNTFTTKPPKDNGTMILSEKSSSDSHHRALDEPSPPKICHSEKSPHQGCVDALPSETTKQDKTTVTHSDPKTDSDPAVEAASAAAQFDTKDNSHLGVSMKDGFPDTSGHHSLDTVQNKANTFNLDDTLDLKGDALLTSTPMVTCKMFNFSTEREEGKFMAAQKKLYGDGPCKADQQEQAEVPANIVCDRKTFFTQPAAKSLLPHLKTASQLLRYKSASALTGRPDPSVSGLPVTRQKAQAAALRKTDPLQVEGYEPDSFISMESACY